MKVMKNILFLLLIAGLLTFTGCGSSDDVKEDDENKEETSSSDRKKLDLPYWFVAPPHAEDALYAVGYAKKKSMQLAMESAEIRAQVRLSRQIEVKVANMVKDFLEESGTAEQSEAIEFSNSVSKSVSENFLSGVRTKEREFYETEEGYIEVFVLVEVSLADMGSRIDQIMKDKAQAYARLRANIAFEELKEELKRLNGDDTDLRAEEGDPTEPDE
ncbi:MAG: LPP20 family lipoprotein [Spirochaetes bacterium]|nr:LPP20 family lipoprotein [Spirochaetota bacterium]